MDRTTPRESAVAAGGAAAFPAGGVSHYFTVDVEEHFQVSAFARHVPRASWDTHESRVVRNTDRILELLAERGVTGTFFVLGWVAEREAGLVRRIVGGGHELASHGWGHRRVPELTRSEFRESVRRSKQLLEDTSGREVLGYRAPSFSILPGLEWALDTLLEEGYRYDSSLFPIRRAGYGYRSAGRDAHDVVRERGTLREFPPATLRLGGMQLPAAGGAYFRLLPYGLVSGALRQAEARRQPAVFYIHPWEVDPQQPRVRVDLATRVRHYGGLHRTLPRLQRLLSDFRFQSIVHGLRAFDAAAPQARAALHA